MSSIKDEIRATLRRKSAWVTWAITAVVFYVLGWYLHRHGVHL